MHRFDVKISSGYFDMSDRRRETDEEKAKRVRREVNDNYLYKKRDYERWERQQAYEVDKAQRTLAKANITLSCNCKCTCCKEN